MADYWIWFKSIIEEDYSRDDVLPGMMLFWRLAVGERERERERERGWQDAMD